jgi:hypothetical protein
MLKVLNLQPGAESKSLYYPSQKQYSMAVANTAHLLDEASTARYTSLYGGSRNDYDILGVRKETYIFYPPSEVPTWALADAGFYFTGNHDISRCFRCGLEIKMLRLGEDPFEVHRRLSANCPYVKEKIDSTMQHLDDSDSEEEDCIDGFSLDIDSSDDSDLDMETDSPCAVVPKLGKVDAFSKNNEYVETSFDSCCAGTAAASACNQKTKLAKPIDKEALRRENARLKSAITCRQCNNAKVQTLFLPCRHLVACEACGESMDDCINCGQKILGTVRTFFI